MPKLNTLSDTRFDELGFEGPFAAEAEAEKLRDAGPLLSELGQTPFAEVDGEDQAFPSGLVLQKASGPTGRDQEHWDPNATGLPLLATGPSSQAQLVSPHFTVRELVSSGGVTSSLARISPHLVGALEAIRRLAGRSVRISSGYRSWAHNKQVYAKRGKTPTKSRHCSGQAADISIAGMSGVDLAKLAIDAAGTDLAIGVGSSFIHVDVRGSWTLWTYFPAGGTADRAAKAAVQAHRQGRLPGLVNAPQPATRPPAARPTAGDRLVIADHPLLRGHRGTLPNLVLRWNRIDAPGDVDVVVHFHGFASSSQQGGMRLDLDKEPISGLDFSDPDAPGSPGRERPTLAILPRGNHVQGRRYDFPALLRRGALQELISDSLQRLGRATGQSLTRGRLILTAHSGGGAALSAILAHTDPDEVHVFDGLYGSGARFARWAERRIAREIATPGPLPPALRILYRPGSKEQPGTQPHSEGVARDLFRSLSAAAAARLRPFFRVDRTPVAHDAMPRRYGWRLLADPAARLPNTKIYLGGPGSWNEAEEELLADESIEATAFEDNEELAWLDVEALGMEAEWEQPSPTEAEGLEPEATEAGWSELGEEHSPEAECLEPEGESEALDALETFEPGESWGEGESEGDESPYAGEEEGDTEGGEEAGIVDRFGEFEDERDSEWESVELEGELEEEGGLAASGLSPAEKKAVEITSVFETGKRGGFFGLAGNFDGQGLSFGLVNWTIGTGSLQPLLRNFAAEQPQRWAAAFGPDAARFLQVVTPQGEPARKAQLRFAVETMNASSIVKGTRKWAVREPWVTYFRRLSEDPEFQKIQIRYVRGLLARGAYFCRLFKLDSELAFAFMFDTVSSHGKWWLTKKLGGQEKRRLSIESRLRALSERHGEGKVPESEVLLAIADVLAATSAPRWAANVRRRKRWFVTGDHPRANELRGLQPRGDLPYAMGSGAPAAPVAAPILPSAPRPAADLGATIARIAEGELRRWHPATGKLKERDSAAVPILQQYYREGVGEEITAAHLQSAAWQEQYPWSAVFVSWVMQTAGAGDSFGPSRAHRVYIRAARRNRLEGLTANPFWAYRATEVAPQVGDLVCASRDNSGANYDNIGDPKKEWKTHCDIVTAIGRGSLRAIGGNARDNNVAAKQIRTLPDGRLALDGNQGRVFAVLRCRGRVPGLEP